MNHFSTSFFITTHSSTLSFDKQFSEGFNEKTISTDSYLTTSYANFQFCTIFLVATNPSRSVPTFPSTTLNGLGDKFFLYNWSKATSGNSNRSLIVYARITFFGTFSILFRSITKKKCCHDKMQKPLYVPVRLRF